MTRLSQARHLAGYLEGDLQGLGIDGAVSIAPWKQPDFWKRQSPIGPQDVQKPRRQHDVAVLAALALLDPNDPARTNGMAIYYP